MHCLERPGVEPAVLCVHGYCQSSVYWAPTLDRLARAGVRGLAPDLPGFGASARLPGPYTMEAYADGLAALLDARRLERVALVGVRQLTYFSARQKDAGRRCDLEAGMAKLLGARVAWANADNALQIHGGNGFALEYPVSRVLCDARILNIFEGAAEIQAQVIARRLLEGAN